MTKWLSEQAGSEIKVPNGLVKIVFDNEQVVRKRYTVKAKCNNVPIRMITSHAYICVNTDHYIQNSAESRLGSWIFNNFSETQENKCLNYASEYQDYFRFSRNELISHRVIQLLSEQNIS